MARHRDPDRWALLYRIAWRIQNESAICCTSRPTTTSALLQSCGKRWTTTFTRCAPSFASAACSTRVAEQYVAWYRPRAPHARCQRTLLRRALRRHALGHPDAGRQHVLGSRAAALWTRRAPLRSARRRRIRGSLARLLRLHLQPGAPEPGRHARATSGAPLG